MYDPDALREVLNLVKAAEERLLKALGDDVEDERIVFPTKRGQVILGPGDIGYYQAYYPTVKVRDQLVDCAAWYREHKSRRPVDHNRAIHKWLKRAQGDHTDHNPYEED